VEQVETDPLAIRTSERGFGRRPPCPTSVIPFRCWYAAQAKGPCWAETILSRAVSASTEPNDLALRDPTGVLIPTLLIVDDHEGLRSFARTVLGAEGFDVIGEAADGETAIVAVQTLHPDVVLLDIGLPGIDGFEVAERLAGVPGAPSFVLTSSRRASDYGQRMADSPARGFLPKHELSGPAIAALLARAPRAA